MDTQSGPAGPVPSAAAEPTRLVLLVDDESDLRQVSRRAIERMGACRVVEAGSAEEALAFSRASPETIEVLVTDLIMPGGSGTDLARILCRERPALRVLVVSGYSHDSAPLRGGLDPAWGYLEKPFTGSQLVSALRALLGPSFPSPPGERAG